MSARTILIVSGIVGALGIVIGAFGAHSLPKLLKDLQPEEFAQRQAWLETGVKYHMYHACLLYTSPSPRDLSTSRMPSSA